MRIAIWCMGVTAIGMVGDSYSQNVKELEDYYRRIDADRLPVYRGYRLNRDDSIRRKVITQLICHFELDTREIERNYDCAFWHYYFEESLPALNHMADDGLIRFDDSRIRVTDKGRLLIRNICMVFDAYNQVGGGFSKVI